MYTFLCCVYKIRNVILRDSLRITRGTHTTIVTLLPCIHLGSIHRVQCAHAYYVLLFFYTYLYPCYYAYKYTNAWVGLARVVIALAQFRSIFQPIRSNQPENKIIFWMEHQADENFRPFNILSVSNFYNNRY